MTMKSAAKRESHPLEDLPFVGAYGKVHPRNFWSVASTGDYEKDCDLGREYARQYLLYQVTDANGTPLLHPSSST
jgi:hypothetical protein